MASYEYPGQFQYDGDTYSAHFNLNSMLRVRDEMKLDPMDVVLITYPKCGTHLMAEIYHNLTISPDAPDENRMFGTTFPRLEFNNMADAKGILPYDLAMSLPTPRRMGSHLGVKFFERMLKDPKICPKFIIVLRDPRDALVSFFHFHKILQGFNDLDWDTFFDMFKSKTIFCGDILEHHTGWKKYKDHSNVFLTNYEDLLERGEGEVRRLAKFLNLSPSDEHIRETLNRSSFAEMKARGPSFYYDGAKIFKGPEPPVFRKGVVGDWRNHFTADQSAYYDERVAGDSI